MGYVERHAEMYQAKGKAHALLGGHLYALQQHCVVPVAPPSQPHRLSDDVCSTLLRRLRGWCVMWTDGFVDEPEPKWYAVICRRHVPVGEIRDSKRRSEMRRALRDCRVARVDAAEIARQGYETYCHALAGYRRKGSRISAPERDEYYRRIMSDAPFADIRHQWAVYVGDVLAGFAQNTVFEGECVNYSLIKLHPGYLSSYTSYALVYRMNEYYLGESRFPYVNDGYRSVSHDTGVQDFLIKKFGFEMACTPLHIRYRPWLNAALALSRLFGRRVAGLLPRARPLLECDRLATTRGMA